MNKQFFLLFLAWSVSYVYSFSQTVESGAPAAFTYQAVVRDADGLALANQAIQMRISILQGSTDGASVYTETHTTTTNEFGLASLLIGNGTVQSGVFSRIAWGSSGPFFLQIEVDVTGGTNFSLMGTTQLLSVPYALYAETAGAIEANNDNATTKSISLSVYSAFLDDSGATLSDGFGINGGLTLSASVSSSFAFSFVLPPDYTTGGAINVNITLTSTVAGDITIRPNFISVARPGLGYIQGGGASTGVNMNNPINIPSARIPVLAEGSITSPDGETALQAGDAIIFGYFRNNDGNTGNVVISGVQITYE